MKRNISKILLGLALFTAIVFTGSYAVFAQDSGIGQRTLNDERVPSTNVKKRIILKKKFPDQVPAAEKEENPAEESAPAEQADEKNDGDAAAPEDAEEEKPSDDAKETEEPSDQGDAAEAEEREVDESMYEKMGNDNDKLASGKFTPEINDTMCAQICERTSEPDCMSKCKRTGFCGLGFVECNRGGKVDFAEDKMPPKE